MTDQAAIITQESNAAGERAMRRVRWRLVPFLCLLFIVNYLDRTNVAMAQLTMSTDVKLSAKTYGLGAGLFFIGYFLFEVPSNLLLQRLGARRWIARILITWGVCSAAMMFTRGPRSFGTLRFLLGFAEAGFFPGIVYYLTHWVPQQRRAKVLAMFLTSTALSGVIGNPLAGWLMTFDGAAGLRGWQWLFLLEGLPPVLLGIAILAMGLLPDTPADAHWMPADERDWIENELRRDHADESVGHVAELRAAASDARLWLLSAIYFCLVMGLYGFVYWVPSIVKSLTQSSNARVGVASAAPYLIGAVAMVFIAGSADRMGARRGYVAVCAALGAGGLAALCVSLTYSHSVVFGMAALCVAAIGIFGSLGPFWAIPTRYLRHTAAAGGIAIINSTGALAGFCAPFAIGWAKTATGSFAAGLLVVAASLAAGAILVIYIPPAIDARR
ncbi:MAG: MFS transporter [Tepidisphaeraceae bacterium]|jgi:sugar phosphate permease